MRGKGKASRKLDKLIRNLKEQLEELEKKDTSWEDFKRRYEIRKNLRNLDDN